MEGEGESTAVGVTKLLVKWQCALSSLREVGGDQWRVYMTRTWPYTAADERLKVSALRAVNNRKLVTAEFTAATK